MKHATAWCVLLACCVPLVLVGQESDPFGPPANPKREPEEARSLSAVEVPASVQARLKALQTPKSDELLSELEQQYLELLKTSPRARHILEAEQLLATTNDNSRWTNYSSATKLLRAHRDKAAIPLLLRYIVVHAERSSSHVMIPEYARTISAISGHRLPSPYEAGPNLPDRMRAAVTNIVDTWWSKQAADLATQPGKMSAEQLDVLVDDLLRRMKDGGRLSGAGGAPDSAYFVYHIMFYGVMNPGSSSYEPPFKLTELYADMTPIVLQRCGFRTPGNDVPKSELRRFRYEAVPLLAALRANGLADGIDEIAADQQQTAAVRLTCLLSLFHAGEPLLTDELIQILEVAAGLENRMIALCALRQAGSKAVPVLLEHLKDSNIEICTAAACSLRETQPREALPLIEHRIRESDNGQSLILLLGTLEAYENEAGRRVLAGLVEDALEGRFSRQYLSRVVYAFENACDQDWSEVAGDREASYELQARVALDWYREHLSEMQRRLQTLTAQVENAEAQLEVAVSIQDLRQAEYKRLLLLQTDEVVPPSQAETAGQLLKQAREETAAHQKSVRELRARLATLKAELE